PHGLCRSPGCGVARDATVDDLALGEEDLALAGHLDQHLVRLAHQIEGLRDPVPAQVRHGIDARRADRVIVVRPEGARRVLEDVEGLLAFQRHLASYLPGAGAAAASRSRRARLARSTYCA